MPLVLDITAAARRDLDSIYDHGTEVFGEAQARRYARQLIDAVNRLTDFPLSAPALTGRRDGARTLATGSHLIIYRVEGDVLRVARVLHQRMDATRHL